MSRFSRMAIVVVFMVLLLMPRSDSAHAASRSATAKHSLPAANDSTPVAVFTFGVKGGSLRPWTVKLALDGTITSTGMSAGHPNLADPKHTLSGLLVLADAEKFFSLKKAIGCLASAGNPDTSSRFIAIHTATGSKRVSEFGTCAATEKYDELFAVLQETAGVGA